MTSYRARPDQAVWLSVPLQFPWGAFASDVEWAAEVAQDRAAEDAPPAVRTALAETALAIVRSTPPLPGVLERFWWLPSIGGAGVVVNLSAVQLEGPLMRESLESFALVGSGGMVQGISTVDETAFDEAIDCVLLIPVEESMIALRRQIGRRDGMLLYLDAFVESGADLYEAEQDITELFASIEVRSD